MDTVDARRELFKRHYMMQNCCCVLHVWWILASIYSSLLHLTKQTKCVHITESTEMYKVNASFDIYIARCTTELKADLTTPEARVPTSSRFSGSGNCCPLCGHELLHGAHSACSTSHVLQVEVVVAGCQRAKFFVDCTGGNRFCAYTPLTSNSTTRTRTGVRTLCTPEHMVWEIAIKKCNSSINEMLATAWVWAMIGWYLKWSSKMIEHCFIFLLS